MSPDATGDRRRARVLVVDDEPDFRDLVRRTLSYCTVSEASDGEHALASLEQVVPDLVVTDIRMPQMDGIELAANLRQRYPRMPVLGVSGFVGPDEVDQDAFQGFLNKPIAVGEFRALVEEALAELDA